jgi:hypothetical protein
VYFSGGNLKGNQNAQDSKNNQKDNVSDVCGISSILFIIKKTVIIIIVLHIKVKKAVQRYHNVVERPAGSRNTLAA